MKGVGYRAQLQGTKLVLSVGKSHQDEVEAPEGITFTVANPTSISVEGINKEVVGQTAAYIRSLRSPEPYKGKGIRYVGEYVRLKEGKQVNNVLSRVWEVLHLNMLDKFNRQLVNETN